MSYQDIEKKLEELVEVVKKGYEDRKKKDKTNEKNRVELTQYKDLTEKYIMENSKLEKELKERESQIQTVEEINKELEQEMQRTKRMEIF